MSNENEVQETKHLLDRIKSKYVLKNIFDLLQPKISCGITRGRRDLLEIYMPSNGKAKKLNQLNHFECGGP